MSIQAFYTVLNGIIAGQGLGELALGAVNIALPFNMVIIALSMLIGERGSLEHILSELCEWGRRFMQSDMQ